MTTYVSAGETRGGHWNVGLSNAIFQTVCTQLKTALDGCGLVQTSDTGQLDPATAIFPAGTNATAGYWIYRFADSRQGVDPIYLKVSPGRGGTAAQTIVYLQVGQGSNGAGTLTGTVSGSMPCGNNYYQASIDPSTTTFACHTDGVAWLAYASIPSGQGQPPRHSFCIARTRNPSTGAFDSAGVMIFYCSGTQSNRPEFIYLDWTDGNDHLMGYTLSFCFAPCLLQYEDDGVTKIAWPHFYSDAGVIKQNWAVWSTHGGNLSSGNAVSFTASPYGTAHTWLSIGGSDGSNMRGAGTSQAAYAVMSAVFIWE